MKDTKHDDGGRAYPQSYRIPGSSTIVGASGMTLWDFYAAAALQGELAAPVQSTCEPWHAGNHDRLAAYVGRIADAMLAERRKRGIGT